MNATGPRRPSARATQSDALISFRFSSSSLPLLRVFVLLDKRQRQHSSRHLCFYNDDNQMTMYYFADPEAQLKEVTMRSRPLASSYSLRLIHSPSTQGDLATMLQSTVAKKPPHSFSPVIRRSSIPVNAKHLSGSYMLYEPAATFHNWVMHTSLS